MRILEGQETKEAWRYIEEAAKEAKKSTCKASQRGVVIIKNGEVIGRGYNKITLKKYCDPCIRENLNGSERVELCSAIHAEQIAILDALKRGESLEGSRMFHIRVKDNEITTSNKTSCTVCSRFILESGVSEFVLYTPKGFALYSAEELNEKSFEHFLDN